MEKTQMKFNDLEIRKDIGYVNLVDPDSSATEVKITRNKLAVSELVKLMANDRKPPLVKGIGAIPLFGDNTELLPPIHYQEVKVLAPLSWFNFVTVPDSALPNNFTLHGVIQELQDFYMQNGFFPKNTEITSGIACSLANHSVDTLALDLLVLTYTANCDFGALNQMLHDIRALYDSVNPPSNSIEDIVVTTDDDDEVIEIVQEPVKNDKTEEARLLVNHLTGYIEKSLSLLKDEEIKRVVCFVINTEQAVEFGISAQIANTPATYTLTLEDGNQVVVQIAPGLIHSALTVLSAPAPID